MILAHTLATLPRTPAPAAMTALAALSTALDTLDDRDALAALAQAVPRHVAKLAPEVSVALAQLASRLAPYGAQAPLDLAALRDRPRVEWLRVLVLAGGTPDPAGLRAVVAGWSVDALAAPLALLEALASADDPGLRLVCLDWLPGAVAGLGLGARAAFDLACALARDPVWSVRRAALESAAFRVRPGLSVQQESRREDALLAGLRDPEPEVGGAALAGCEALGRADWLRDFAREPSLPVALRGDALGRFGGFAAAADLAWMLTLAADPDLAEAGRTALLAAHRRGAFLDASALDAALACFDANPGWTADELVRVAWLARVELVEVLATLPADDPRWVRRALILAVCPVEGAPAILARLVREATDLQVLHAAIDAAGRTPDFTAADVLCERLTLLPEVTLTALRAKADEGALRRIEAFTEEPALVPRLRRRAYDVLWAHRLDPGLVGRAGVLARLAIDTPDADLVGDPSARERLTLLCKTGSIHALPAVRVAFRECVIECVRGALAGDFSVKRIELPAIEQTVYRYGRAMIASGLVVRRWNADTPETGRDLLLGLICEWLDEGPGRAVMVALLEAAARHAPDGPWLRRIEPYWRRGEREVRRAAVDAILGAGEAAAGLALSLSRLVEAPSGRIAERGLEAIAAFEARWAEPLVLQALERPEMAVKKAAAEALRVIASPAAAPTILEWLAQHDNPRLRGALKAALSTAAGAAAPALIVEAFAAEADPRRRGLLIDALSGGLTLAGLVRLTTSGRGCAEALIDAALDGRLRLADATRDATAARLHRLKLREAEVVDDPTADLRDQGFTPARAEAVLAHWRAERDPRCVAAVRQRLAEWIAWCPADDAAELALTAAQRGHAHLLDALLALAPRAGTAVALPFIERCVVDPTPAQRQAAIGWVRRLPDAPEPGGLARFDRLVGLGAVVTRADLKRCLAECATGPPRRAVDLLRRAFPTLPDTLRSGLVEWHARSDLERTAWLDAALDACPLGGAAPRAVPERRCRPPETIASLVAALDDPQRRDAVLGVLLARPAAAAIWSELRERVLTGALDLPAAADPRLAATVTRWPTEPAAQAIARRWLGHLSGAQQRALVPTWISRRAAGDVDAEICLRAVDAAILLPEVWARRATDPTLARLVSPGPSQAVRALAAWLREHAPDEAARFERPPEVAVEAGAVDPLDDLDFAGLCRLIAAEDTAHGLAVRAVHALTRWEAEAIEPLAGWATDPRPKVRSAALRALKTVAPRARSLEATLAALHMETRRDVALALMRSLGHRRFEPALPALIERVAASDGRTAEGAREALEAFGEAAVPALEHAARRARPDRRGRYRAVIAAIEGDASED